MADLTVKGLAELRAAFEQLPARLVNGAIRAGLRQGANLVKNQAKANFNHAPGPKDLTAALKASIRVTQRRGTPTRVVFNVVAGDLTKAQVKRFGKQAAFYALMVERGHWVNNGKALAGGRKDAARARRIAGGETRYVPAHPYMRPAIEAKAQAAIDVMIDTIGAKLPEAVR